MRIKLNSILLFTLCFAFTSCKVSSFNKINETIQATAIIKMAIDGKPIILKNCEIVGDVNFLNTALATPYDGGNKATYIQSSMYFENCNFKGSFCAFAQDKSNYSIHRSIFEKIMSFVNCTFNEDMILKDCSSMASLFFRNCTFKNNLNFQNLKVAFSIGLIECKVIGVAKFQNMFINESSDFYKTLFDSTCLFQSSYFNTVSNFNATIFNDYTDFGSCNFNYKCYFNYANFKEKALFVDARFKDVIEFNNATFNEGNFSSSYFSLAPSFKLCHIQKWLNFKDCKFYDVKPSSDYDAKFIY